MDTVDLSVEAYKAIISESEEFSENVTLQFGLLSDHCNDEDDFLEKSHRMIKKMKNYGSDKLHEMFFGHPPPKKEYVHALEKILKNIAEVQKIPFEKRTFE